jgi:hypothetical protein
MFTAELGTIDSLPGNLALGSTSPLRQNVSQSLDFSDHASMVGLEEVSQPIAFSQSAGGIVARPAAVRQTLVFGQFISPGPGFGENAMSFTGRLGSLDSQPGNLEPGVDVSNSLEQIVSQTLDFVQNADTTTRQATGTNTLAFVSLAVAHVDRPASASNTLSFTQFSSGLHAVFGSVSQSITFVDSAVERRDRPQSVSQTLAFVQNIHENIINIAVSQSMSLVDSATERVNPIRVSVNQSLNLFQDGDDHLGVTNKLVGQVLSFTDKVGRVLTASVSQSISFTQTGERRNAVNHVLTLTQLARAGKGGLVEQTLALVQTVVNKSVFRRTIPQALGLNQSVTYFIVQGCVTKQYSPFVGGTSVSGYTAPSTTAPTLVRGPMTLTYPYVSPTSTLVFRNPEFGDKDRLLFNRVNRETRGGTLIVFADPKWPKTQILSVQVDNLGPEAIANFLTFLQDSLGQEIGLLDWEGRQWRGIIITPDTQATHVGKHDRSVTFEFQGRLA